MENLKPLTIKIVSWDRVCVFGEWTARTRVCEVFETVSKVFEIPLKRVIINFFMRDYDVSDFSATSMLHDWKMTSDDTLHVKYAWQDCDGTLS